MELLTTREVAQRIGLTEQRIRQMIAARMLPALKLGRNYGISPSHLGILRHRRKPGRPRVNGTAVQAA